MELMVKQLKTITCETLKTQNGLSLRTHQFVKNLTVMSTFRSPEVDLSVIMEHGLSDPTYIK